MPAADVVELIKNDHHELGDRAGQAKREDLEQQAINAGLSPTRARSKEEIKQDLLEHAQQSGE